MISSVHTELHTKLQSHPNSKMLEILNFVEYIWVSELDSASMQGWLHREAFVPFPSNVAHLLAKAMAVLPKPPPTSTPFLGSPLGNLPQGFCPTWASQVELLSLCSQDQVRASFPAGCHLPRARAHGEALRGLEEDAVNIRYRASGISLLHRSACQPFPTPLWRTVSLPARAFSLHFHRKRFLHLSTKPRGKGTGLSFTVGHSVAWKTVRVGVNVLQSWHKCSFQ